MSPCRIISGSATPIESTRARIISTATSNPVASYLPSGCKVTDAPPCRSRPRAGLLPAIKLAVNALATITINKTKEMMWRRLFIVGLHFDYSSFGFIKQLKSYSTGLSGVEVETLRAIEPFVTRTSTFSAISIHKKSSSVAETKP